MMTNKLNLNFTQPDEIKIFSAHLQDMIIRTSDMAFLQPQYRFIAAGNRFCWEKSDKNYRIFCGFHFDGALQVSYRDISRDDPDQFVHLLAVCFNETDPPAGIIRLIFSGQGEIRLKVEAIQIHLQDIGEHWTTTHRPQHLTEHHLKHHLENSHK